MDFGAIFDFGGEGAGDSAMQTPEEQSGGFLDWLVSPGIGVIPAETQSNIAQSVQDRFVRKSVADLLAGPEFAGLDLLQYTPPKQGWFSGISLTDAGKKWLLIGGAVAAGLWIMGRR